RDLRRAAADVDDHVAGRCLDRKADTDRRGHWLRDHEHFLRAGTERRVTHRALLHFRDTRGYTHDHARFHLEHVVLDDEREEVPEHLLGDVEVRDDPVLHRTHSEHPIGCASKHAFGFETDALDLLRFAIDRDDRGFVQYDAFA